MTGTRTVVVRATSPERLAEKIDAATRGHEVVAAHVAEPPAWSVGIARWTATVILREPDHGCGVSPVRAR